MRLNSAAVRRFSAATTAALLLAVLAPVAPTPEQGPVKVRASETTHRVEGVRDFAIAASSTHIAIHWAGHPDAAVTASFSTDGTRFSEPAEVELDEGGNVGPAGDESYGALMGVEGVSVVRVGTDRPLAKVTVLALDAAGDATGQLGLGATAAGVTSVPGVIPRSAWGADESLRFDWAGDELWPREYFPLQKLVVHHTAGRNADPNPAATVRAIYYYHAVTRGWGDIGYSYLIDEAGRVYEGRHARDFWNGATPTSDDVAGLAVAGGHAKYHNQGTMSISLLGTFTTQAPTSAARASLVRMLAWASAKYGINPKGSGTYVNPQTGVTRYTANIGGHRDYQSTGCPGGALYALLPTIRSEVAAQMNTWPGKVFNPQRRLYFAAGTYVGRKFSSTGAITATKSYTLVKASSAPSNGWSTVPVHGGNWYYVTAGVWAGYWVQASSRITVSPAPVTPALELFATARPLSVPAGSKTARKFNTLGQVIASKPYTWTSPSVVWTTEKSAIPNQGGNWYRITVGDLEGYWILDMPGMSLGAPPPPLPTPIAVYSPERSLWFAASTYTGKRYSPYGVLAGTKTYTLSKASSAPTRRLSALPGQTGYWYYVVDGVWDGYWIREQAGVTLSGTVVTSP
jgi:hypothetical protein